MKDRYTLLSPRLLDELRRYYRIYRPAEWLFTDHRRHTPMDSRSASRIYQVAKKRAGIQKAGGIHTLRHAFATHLLESGIAVVSIQRLLGHARVETTAHYLHVTPQRVGKWASPLDLLRLPPVSPA